MTAKTVESDERERCSWCGRDELYVRYHDVEWGVPVHDDNRLFELLTLEGAQAGLSWLTVLRRREGYRRVFEDFDPEVVARYDDARVDEIMSDLGIVRHRQKVNSTVTNARAIVDVQREHGSFERHLWTIATSDEDSTTVSKAMSKQLLKDGFKFVGPTICFSLMQASGMVNDHAENCFRFKEIEALRDT